jgi:hypothetical protein
MCANLLRYVPARSAWNGPSPPVEPPSSSSNIGDAYGGRPTTASRARSSGSDVYYEDVDPRFAAPSEPVPPLPTHQRALPPALAAGPQPSYHDESPDSLQIQPPPLSNSYEDLPGARSPAESETSNFTSVSQRGVNPNWRPSHPGEFSSLGPMRRQSATQQRRDMILDENPDFQLPGMGRRPGGPRPGYSPGMGGGRMPPPGAAGPDGPYARGGMLPHEHVREI